MNVTVQIQGTCPAGHEVTRDLPIQVVRGAEGTVTATKKCPPPCGGHINLAGRYTT